MALKSNRVGVRTDQVDAYGRVTSKSFLQSILDHLPRWTSLKVWKNGTEQLLPVNTDEPVTSPIVADIQYPTDSSATEQMFTYRKSPTDADGEAYIQSIKGNTLVWNQLAQLGAGVANACTKSYDSSTGITTITPTNYSSNNVGLYNLVAVNDLKLNHKYLVSVEANPTANLSFSFGFGSDLIIKSLTANSFQSISTILSWSASSLTLYARLLESGWASGTYQMRNAQCFDLTTIFGSTKADEIYAMETAQAGSGVAYFKSLFPLPYYKYDAGSLLSFNGTGIKTIGKNQIALPVVAYNTLYSLPLSGYYPLLKGTYVLSYTANKDHRFLIKLADANGNLLGDGKYKPNTSMYYSSSYEGWILGADRPSGDYVWTITIVEDCFCRIGRSFTNPDTVELTNVQLEVGSTATSYEPYTTSTTTIPTDTYFPTGMKSAGTAYDEFTSSRAYTRIGEVDLGTLTWERLSDSYPNTFNAIVSDIYNRASGTVNNAICSNYESENVWLATALSDKKFMIRGDTKKVYIHDSSYSDATAFKTAMSGVMLQYELAEEIIEPTLTFDEE